MKKFDIKRLLLILFLFILVLSVLAMIYTFTSKNAEVSNEESKGVAQYLEGFLAQHLEIGPSDYFWGSAFNTIVRKTAHFLEYMLLAMVLCSLLNAILRKAWLSAAICTVICPIIAVWDEYRQQFIMGRTPRRFDVAVDYTGALIGILIVTIICAEIWKIRRLKERIRILEEEKKRFEKNMD